MNVLSVENVSKSYGERFLFEQLSFGLNAGQKMALIAPNGSGKSTLFKMLKGIEQPDTGLITFRNGIYYTFLDQEEPQDKSQIALDFLYDIDHPKFQLIKKYKEALNAGTSIDHLLDEMEQENAWNIEHQMDEVLQKLELLELKEKPLSALSGGQLKRLMLTKCLVIPADIYFLDEPTNHLDLDMIEWLEDYLSQSKSALFLISHDRYFLEAICDDILELDGGDFFKHKGAYASYVEGKEKRYEVLQANIDKARNIYRKEIEWVRRMPKARGTKSKSRLEAFKDIKKTAHQRISDDSVNLEINFERLGSKILEFHKVSKRFDNKILLDQFEYVFKRDAKIGIIGKNGVGKTTMIRMILDELAPDAGKIVLGETVKIGYYSQKGLQVKEDKTVIEVVKDIAEFIPLKSGQKISALQLLERFLFRKEQHYQQIKTLSGGERKKLYLLTVLMQNPNFLILDEPTNDLDIDTLTELEAYLQQFRGCCLIVSHDRYFMDKMVDELLVFKGAGKVSTYPGSYSLWRSEHTFADYEKEAKAAAIEVKENVASPKAAQKSKLTYAERLELPKLEASIEHLEGEVERVNTLMSSTTDSEELQVLVAELAKLGSQLEKDTERWMMLIEKQGDA